MKRDTNVQHDIKGNHSKQGEVCTWKEIYLFERESQACLYFSLLRKWHTSLSSQWKGVDFPHSIMRKISESVHNDTYTKSQLIPERTKIVPSSFCCNWGHTFLSLLPWLYWYMLQLFEVVILISQHKDWINEYWTTPTEWGSCEPLVTFVNY